MKRPPVLPTLLLTALAAGSLWQSALAEEPSRRSLATASMLVPFDAYAKHREAIGLSEDQVKELGRISEGMGDAARKLDNERRERAQALQEAVSQRPIDMEKAMMRFQAVLQAENEMKALQFRSGLAAQNLLSPEQAAKAQAIAAKTQSSRDGSNGEAGAVRERLEQLKGELRKRGGGELSKDSVGTLERVEQAAQQGKLEEAKKQLEGLIVQLGHAGDARGKEKKETGGNAQPSLAEIQDQASKIKAKLAETTDPEAREHLQQQLAKFHAMQERLAGAADRPEKGPSKGDGENKEKGSFNKGDGENKEKRKQPDGQEKGTVKGEGDAKEKGKFDKNAENTIRPDSDLRKQVDVALGAFQEAKAAGNHEGMEKIAKAIESLLQDSARDGGGKNDGAFKDGSRKEGAPKDGAPKEGSTKEGFRKEAAPKEGAAKE